VNVVNFIKSAGFTLFFIFAGLSVLTAEPLSDPLKGLITERESGEPIPGATIYISELQRGVVADDQGEFEIRDLSEGRYTLVIQSVGFGSMTMEVSYPSDEWVRIELVKIRIESDDIIVTASPIGRNVQYQPAYSLNRVELQEKAAPSLGEILDGSPGVAMRSFGSAPSRPVIRGLDGDRVLILQNSERMGDMSSTAHDHAVALDPLAIERVEVIRGPASLLYGSSALGGVVNLFSHDLPQDWDPGMEGSLISHGATVNRLAAGLARGQYRTDKFAFSGSFALRDAGNVRTPEGVLPGTFLNSYSFGSGVGFRGNEVQTGVAITGMRYAYGLPEETDKPDEDVEIRMNRYQLQSVTTLNMSGFFRKAEFRLSANRYLHDEIEIERRPDGQIEEELELGFDQSSLSSSVTFIHNPVSGFEGAFGFSGMYRDVQVRGAEALTPDASSYFLAAFLYEELDLGRGFSLQSGGRLEIQHIGLKKNAIFDDLEGFENRMEWIFSGAAGLNYRPSNNWEIGMQVARAFRTPTLEELYSDAPHIGAGAYEIGNQNLKNEVSIGTDLFVVHRNEYLNIEIAGFLNRIDNFVSYSPTGDIHELSQLPVFIYDSVDAILYGFEISAEAVLNEHWKTGIVLDYVTGSQRDEALTPLPFIPPLRTSFTLRYNKNNWWLGSRIRYVNSQSRVAPDETPTPGYTLLGLDAGYRIGTQLTLALRMDNLLDINYRDHLTRIEERNNPMPGRNLNASIRWDF
jgi:iron complex outermembrane recepter protein